MGHHINEKGQFQSDKFPELAPDKIVLSFKDPVAREALMQFAGRTKDMRLGADILLRCMTITEESGESKEMGQYGHDNDT